MKQNTFDITRTCACCLRKAGEEVDLVLPVHDWDSGKLLGYFCKDHYMEVKSKNINRTHFGLNDFDSNDVCS